MKIFDKVIAVFEELQIQNPKLDDYLDADLAMDSQEIVELAFQLEKVFEVSFKLGDIKRNMKVSDVVQFLEKKIQCLQN